jgi:hypothetical protein
MCACVLVISRTGGRNGLAEFEGGEESIAEERGKELPPFIVSCSVKRLLDDRQQ